MQIIYATIFSTLGNTYFKKCTVVNGTKEIFWSQPVTTSKPSLHLVQTTTMAADDITCFEANRKTA